MNANTIAKHYDKLTPRERWSLMMAADGRGDEAEAEQLVQSAPWIPITRTDVFPLAQAWREMADFTQIELLSLAVRFWTSYGCMLDPNRANNAEKLLRMFSSAFNVLWTAWHQFCKGVQVNTDTSYFKRTPGDSVLRRTAEAIGRIELSAAEVDDRALRVTEELQNLRETFEARASFWGCAERR